VIRNCTIGGNTATFGGGIACVDGSSPEIINTWVYGNTAGTGLQIWLGTEEDPSTLYVAWSDVQGGSSAAFVALGCTLNWGESNIDFPLMNVGPTDFHLTATSPCIDAGNDSLGAATDIEGDMRPYGAHCDIGVDEYTDPALHHIEIWDDETWGNRVTSRPLATGETLTLWAIGYKSSWERIGPVPVIWVGTGVCTDMLTPVYGNSTTLAPDQLGIGDVIAYVPSTQSTATITVVPIVDLQVTDIQAPAEGWSGQNAEVTWTVTNSGTGDESGSWYDRVYLSSDNQSGSDDTYLGEFEISGDLAAGATYQRTETVKVPDGIEGDYYICVYTNIYGSVSWYDYGIYEYNSEGTAFTNNQLVDDLPIAVHLSLYPDLQVTDIQAPAEGWSGQNIQVSWMVTNSGTGNASGTWYDYMYHSSDNL